MAKILVTMLDEVAGKETVEVLGPVSVKRFVWFNPDKEGMVRRLQLEAELMGANAITNMVYKSAGFCGTKERCSGIAKILR